MPQISESFVLNSTSPNFSRDRFENWNEMTSVNPEHLDVGHISYCEEQASHYVFVGANEKGEPQWVDLLATKQITTVKDITKINIDSSSKLPYPLGSLIYDKKTGCFYYTTKEAIEPGDTSWFAQLADSSTLSEYYTKDEVDNDFAKKSDIKNIIGDYIPDSTYENTWIGNDYIPEFRGLKGEDLKDKTMSYADVFDKLFFQKHVPEYSTPVVSIGIKENDLKEHGFEWYDKQNKIILIKRGNTAPDASYFYPVEYTNSYINYPENVNLSSQRQFTNGVITNSTNSNVSKPYCKVKLEDGTWDYYKHEGEIYHIPTALTEPEYRYYLGAKFYKNYPLRANDNSLYNGPGVINGYWDESTVIESLNYITIVTSLPTKYNTIDGMVENPILFWSDNMVDYFELGPTCRVEQKFSLPRKAKKIYIWNDLCGYAEDLSFVEIEGIDSDDYFTYSYDHISNGHRGAIKIKVEF